MTKLHKLIGLFLATAALACGGALQNYSGIITNEIDQMTTNFSPLFLAEGQTVFTSIAVIMLVILGLRVARASLAAHHLVLPLDELVHFFFLFVLAETLLRFWNVPSALFGGYNAHQLIPVIAYSLANKININSLNLLTSQVDTILTNTPIPGPLQVTQIVFYFIFTGLLTVITGILFVLTIIGFVAIGIGTLLGPLMVPFILVPRFSWIFYNWISYTIKYSFYQVVANALVFVWAGAFVFVVNNLFGGVYNPAKAVTEIGALVLLSAGMLASIWLITHFVNDLFTGAAHAGGGIAGSVKTQVMRIFK
jgi:hypothetical protein